MVAKIIKTPDISGNVGTFWIKTWFNVSMQSAGSCPEYKYQMKWVSCWLFVKINILPFVVVCNVQINCWLVFLPEVKGIDVP